MKAWLLYSREAAKRNESYIELYIAEGKKMDLVIELILVEEIGFGTRDSRSYMARGSNIISTKEYPDFVVSRIIYPLLNKQFEKLNIPVFNNSVIAEICNDKARTHQYLANKNITMVDTDFYKNHELESVLLNAKTPIVIKSVEGHGGEQVFLFEAKSYSSNDDNDAINHHIIDIIKGIGSSDFLVQPYIKGRNQDLRVYVIGDEIIAAVLREAKSGFKSNFSLGGEVSLYQLNDEEISIVNKIINEFDFGLVGIDFLIGEQGELLFNEIEDVVGSRMLYSTSNINIVKKYLEYILWSIKER